MGHDTRIAVDVAKAVFEVAISDRPLGTRPGQLPRSHPREFSEVPGDFNKEAGDTFAVRPASPSYAVSQTAPGANNHAPPSCSAYGRASPRSPPKGARLWQGLRPCTPVTAVTWLLTEESRYHLFDAGP